MFCYQCEQTAKGEGCTKIGVCGKAAGGGGPAGSFRFYALKGIVPGMPWRAGRSGVTLTGLSTSLPVEATLLDLDQRRFRSRLGLLQLIQRRRWNS